MAIADQSQLLGIESPGYFKWMGMRGIESLLVWNGHAMTRVLVASPGPRYSESKCSTRVYLF